jgi:ATP-dependent protease ClpP protease subunit
LIKPNKNYRANPARSVFVQGDLNQALVDRLTPQIVALHGINRDPITVYIDSPGGNTFHQEMLSRLLRCSDQNMADPCWIITAVTGRAASAASDLLCSGDYALAYSGSSVFFHGSSRSDDGPITVAAASAMTKSLRLTNDRYALALADKSITRIGFRYVSVQSDFDKYRAEEEKPTATNLECFIGLISRHLSPMAKKLVEDSRARNARYETLIDGVSKRAGRSKRFTNPKREAEMESAVIKAIVDFELSRNRKYPRWTFRQRGIDQLHADFLLVNEYLNIYDSAHLQKLCDMLGNFILTPGDTEELGRIENEEQRAAKRTDILKSRARPIWLFFVALCYALQEDDNDLRATDAFWLGLIDEVIGHDDLFPARLIHEYVIDPQPEAPELPPQAA